MNPELKGRGAAVAAGTSGLGLATAKALAAEGVRVAICGRNSGRLEAALAETNSAGVTAVGSRGFPLESWVIPMILVEP